MPPVSRSCNTYHAWGGRSRYYALTKGVTCQQSPYRCRSTWQHLQPHLTRIIRGAKDLFGLSTIGLISSNRKACRKNNWSRFAELCSCSTTPRRPFTACQSKDGTYHELPFIISCHATNASTITSPSHWVSPERVACPLVGLTLQMKRRWVRCAKTIQSFTPDYIPESLAGQLALSAIFITHRTSPPRRSDSMSLTTKADSIASHSYLLRGGPCCNRNDRIPQLTQSCLLISI